MGIESKFLSRQNYLNWKNETSACFLNFLFENVKREGHIFHTFSRAFVELGGGVDDVLGWRPDGAYVELGFR